MTAILLIVGRFLLGFYFLQAGIRNLRKMPLHIDILTKKQIPMPRETLLFALAVQIVGALMVMLGIFPALGAFGLIGFTIVANALYHDFWNYSGDERTPHLNSVITNAAFVGAFLIVIAVS